MVEPILAQDTRVCLWCGASLAGRQVTAKYCSHRCRKCAHYQTNKEQIAAKDRVHYQVNKEMLVERQRVYRQVSKEAVRHTNRTYHRHNKETIAARKYIYRQANKERIAARHRVYRQVNKEALAERQRAYHQANPDIYRLATARKRARKHHAPINDLTAAQWREIQEHYNGVCSGYV